MTAQNALDLWDEPGRVEAGIAAAIQAARDTGQLEPTDAGSAALAVELARAVDTASRALDVRGVAAAGRELREVTARLRLDPTARGSSGDAFSDLLKELSTPSRAAPVGDRPQP